jgi:hypothetical protein
MPTLSERLQLIDNMSDAYGAITGTDRRAFTVDLLTDLLHWCEKRKIAFETSLAFARANKLAENAGGVARTVASRSLSPTL